MELKQIIENLITKIGFEDFSVTENSDGHRFHIIISDVLIEKSLPGFMDDFNHIVKMIAKKNDGSLIIVDVNNYRKKREELILELARAAARKAATAKEPITLPAMNSYERRLIHAELANRPDLTTESSGEGSERYVVIKPL